MAPEIVVCVMLYASEGGMDPIPISEQKGLLIWVFCPPGCNRDKKWFGSGFPIKNCNVNLVVTGILGGGPHPTSKIILKILW